MFWPGRNFKLLFMTLTLDSLMLFKCKLYVCKMVIEAWFPSKLFHWAIMYALRLVYLDGFRIYEITQNNSNSIFFHWGFSYTLMHSTSRSLPSKSQWIPIRGIVKIYPQGYDLFLGRLTKTSFASSPSHYYAMGISKC